MNLEELKEKIDKACKDGVCSECIMRGKCDGADASLSFVIEYLSQQGLLREPIMVEGNKITIESKEDKMKSCIVKLWYEKHQMHYYLDLNWGQKHGLGGGYIAVLPIGEELKFRAGDDNRISIEAAECEFIFNRRNPLVDQIIGSFCELSSHSATPEETEAIDRVCNRMRGFGD